MHFFMGTGIYGQVKRVGSTPIVTKFIMFQLLPIFPLRSIYATSPVEETMEGIPFIASTTSAEVDGFPLARIDWGSVMVAYCRAICVILLIPGSIGMMLCFTIKHQPPPDWFAQMTMHVLTIAFFVGLTAGALSYLVPLTNRRDATIRLFCGEILDAYVDPAKIDPDHLSVIDYQASRGTAYEERESAPETRRSLIRDLIACRIEIALGNDVASMEEDTDDLLIQIARFDS